MYFTHPQLKLNIKNLLLFFKPINKAKLPRAVFTDSGRSAFILAIEHLGLQNSEMLVPAYICDIFLPIFKHFNIKPIYLDINLTTFNVVNSEIEKKITPKTKSILVCHTYGNLADEAIEAAKKYNLKIIEDCAHIFPKKLQGDCAFFSLPKFLPVVDGGILICRGASPTKLRGRTPKFSDLIKFFRLFPFLATISEKFRRSYERNNKFTKPRKPYKCSLRILNRHLNNFEKQISKRKELAEYFHKKLQEIGLKSSGTTYISALVENRDQLFEKLRKKKIFCSRIWHKPIYPELPNTQEAAKRIINLPLQNWFTKKDIDKIIKWLKWSIDQLR